MKVIGPLVFVILAPLTCARPAYLQAQLPDEHWTCPTITVSCPEDSSPKRITFKAYVAQGVPIMKLHYKWRVSGGKIISGQGTEEISVKSKRHKGQIVTATVELPGIEKDCNKTASCSTRINSP